MEEQVGALWHRLVTRASERRFPAAAVRLEDVVLVTADGCELLTQHLGWRGKRTWQSASA